MKRDERIDIIKGLAIVLMVIGHSGFPFKSVIYLFHMAVFFMVSGYLFSLRKVTSVKGGVNYVYKKIKGIWWPYFLWNAVYTLLNNVFLYLGVYSKEAFVIEGVQVGAHSTMGIKEMAVNIIKGVFLVGRTEMGGAFWFLRILFGISILFALIDFVLNKVIRNDKCADVIHFIISTVFMCVGYVAYLVGIKSISVPVILSTYILYFMGYAIKKYNVMERVKIWWALPVSAVVLLVCDRVVGISLGDNRYGNPGYLILCSLAGWMLLYSIADLLNRYRGKKMWSVLGKNSLAIVIHHFWCFKLVHLLQMLIYSYPKKCMAAFPYLNAAGAWWVVYTIVGVGLPLGISFLSKRVKDTVTSCRT